MGDEEALGLESSGRNPEEVSGLVVIQVVMERRR